MFIYLGFFLLKIDLHWLFELMYPFFVLIEKWFLLFWIFFENFHHLLCFKLFNLRKIWVFIFINTDDLNSAYNQINMNIRVQ